MAPHVDIFSAIRGTSWQLRGTPLAAPMVELLIYAMKLS